MRKHKKYSNLRNKFRKEFYKACAANNALAMLAIETYTAYQHRSHISKIWALLGHNHRRAYKDYCDKLMGTHLTGRSEIFKSLYFSNRELYDKYHNKIPEVYALGDALSVAYKVLKKAC